MRATRFSVLLLTGLVLLLPAVVLAATPQPRISGTGGAFPIDDREIDVTTIASCVAPPVSGGLGVYGDGPWQVAQSWSPTTTTSLAGVMLGVSMNGFTTLTLVCELHADDGFGHPGALLATSNPKTVNNPPSYPSAAKVSVRFAVPPPVVAGTSYVLVWSTPPVTGGACFVVGAHGVDPCSGIESQSIDGGATWNDDPYGDGGPVDQFYRAVSNP